MTTEQCGQDQLPIGLFDSGVGGLTVLDAMRRLMPGEDYLFLGDTARVPYGAKSQKTIVRYSLQAAAKLIGQRIHRIEPGVVPRVLVLLARIPQTRDHIQLVTYFRHSSLEE